MADAGEPKEQAVKAPSAPSDASAATGPTLADVAKLTPDSNYAVFTAPDVDSKVRNEALRKLFLTDPHFRQADDLDVRVDEVVGIEASPLARQYKIQQARALGLLDDELLDQNDTGTGPRPC